MHPPSLNPKHFQELALDSGIDRDLALLNFISLEGDAFYEYLLISNRIPRTNTGMVSSWWLHRYAHGAKGGWWCSGLDPLNDWRLMEWGCYKPNHPRPDKKGKLIKYEHPPCTPTRIFCLRVPLHIWQQTASRYGVPMPEKIAIAQNGEALGFWQWVLEMKIPTILCEGAKKAAALLTQGYAAIALPGITSGYRVTKDFQGNVLSRQLIPDLLAFTRLKRTFFICFDYETQPKTIKAVNQAQTQLGELLEEQKCPVKIIRLPGLQKGVDDFIVAQGAAAFQTVYEASLNLETDLAKSKPHTELTYSPALTLNRRYLEKLPFPTSGLVGIKSAKGTGKTTALVSLIQQAKNRGDRVLLLTHRIQLGQFLCEKIGVNWINHRTLEKRDKNPDNLLPIAPSLGLCIDSIWKLNPEHWQGAIVILDEVEQSLWHLLNSDTCKDKRIKILRVFQQLISTVLKTGGLVIAQDADLSDLSLDYLKGLAGIKIEPWVVLNEWKPDGWDVTFHNTPNPTLLIQQLELDLIAGRKCYVTTDSRSGRYSSETIDRYIKQRLEQFLRQYPKTLVVSSQTTSTPGHEAVNFVEAINQKALDYDAVFVTPSLGTGVSIDVEHFDRVYGIFQGVIPDSEARQALARVRQSVPRIVWCAKRGIGMIGSGSKNYRVLSHWYQENQKENLALMSPLHPVDVDLPLVYDLIHLRSWAKFAARVNASITLYRQSMLEGLIAEGHQVNVMSDAPPHERLRELRMALLAAAPRDWETSKKLVREIVKIQQEFEVRRKKTKSIKHQIVKIRNQIELQAASAVANSPDIERREYERLLTKRSLTDEERNQVQKYILKQRYGVEVTPQLKLRDDRGYYSQLLVHYYLTHESEYFQLQDQQEWHQQLERGEGKVFLPDLNTYTLKIEALRALGVLQFIHPEREFKETDLDLVELKATALRCSKHIKRAIGISIPMETEKERLSCIKVLSKVLNLLGLKLRSFKRKENGYKNPLKVYKIDSKTLDDGRNEIFEAWRYREGLIEESVSNQRVFTLKSERCTTPYKPALFHSQR
ncbi:DUF3854 domain-containing protein [Coleofasciculus sp. FACHB-64]|uniref:plasmid replication protein, CyRepA1 family n=1 Tax=Cyanophyceae TaxID=3028117 RepID=UPI001687E855|nr:MULTISPECIES: plasmid replication protein, CyRepA1 family [unclassified Coleofasciculus]MBD1837426.1 DUF3854 domain-containing protein [Coleofasciculus sp. FACHB-501]MBD2045533.1 DUF3854 domain-containing protein [Coleofasciculus sp. FACHB-64]